MQPPIFQAPVAHEDSPPAASDPAGGDFVDLILSQWQQHAPGADISPMHVTSRIWRLAALLDRDMQRQFREHSLQMGDFDVVAALYRSGPPYTLHPQQLTAQLLLTSGAMTYRLDSLEKRGLITRTPNPDDRRSIFVSLTGSGQATLRAALDTYMAEMKRVLHPLDDAECRVLATLLRKILLPYDRT